MKYVFYALIALSFLYAAYLQIFGMEALQAEHAVALAQAVEAGAEAPVFRTPMDNLTSAALEAAKASVGLAISLIGGMALFLGVMKVAEDGGLLTIIAKTLRPITVRLFPDVPANHPAMGAIILNMSANALGLGNAATPFGIRAMQELDKLNPHKGTATNAMALFLAINTSALALLPTGVMVIRQELGSMQPGAIFATTLLATSLSTMAGITAAKLYQRVWPSAETVHRQAIESGEEPPEANAEVRETDDDAALVDDSAYPAWVSFAALGALALFIVSLIAVPTMGEMVSPWVIPVILFGMLTFGLARGVNIYSSVVQGAKAGWDVAVMIIPFLVAILVAVGMFRANGLLLSITSVVGPITELFGMPAEALPMALLRPLSGSGAYGVMMDILSANGPDSYVGLLVSTLQGSTETTFYVLAVYYGAVQVKRIRHTMAAALTADFFGIAAAIGAVLLMYGRSGIGCDDDALGELVAEVEGLGPDAVPGRIVAGVSAACGTAELQAAYAAAPADQPALLRALVLESPAGWALLCDEPMSTDGDIDYAGCDADALDWNPAGFRTRLYDDQDVLRADGAPALLIEALAGARLKASGTDNALALMAQLEPTDPADAEGVRLGDIELVGALSEDAVRDALLARVSAMRACSNDGGDAVYSLTVPAEGPPAIALRSASFEDTDVRSCLTQAVAGIELAAPVPGGIAFATVPVTLIGDWRAR